MAPTTPAGCRRWSRRFPRSWGSGRSWRRWRCSTTRTRRRCCARCCPRATPSSSRARATHAPTRRRRFSRWRSSSGSAPASPPPPPTMPCAARASWPATKAPFSRREASTSSPIWPPPRRGGELPRCERRRPTSPRDDRGGRLGRRARDPRLLRHRLPVRQAFSVGRPGTLASAMPPVAIFGIDNGAVNTAINLLILVLVVVWLALVYWTYADARRRIADPMLVACATCASLFPFIGTIVYMIVRPPEYLDDVRERELEIAAAQARLANLEHQHCQYCGFEIEKSFLRCPSCLRRLKEPCTVCGKPLDPRWKICPFCEAEVGQAA